MKPSSMHRGFAAGNPLSNILAVIVGTLAIAASIVLGFFAFVIIGGIVAMLAAVIGIRVWWFKRKLQGHVRTEEKPGPAGVIEGEYRVVADDREGE